MMNKKQAVFIPHSAFIISVKALVGPTIFDADEVETGLGPVFQVEGAARRELPDFEAGEGERPFRLADFGRVVAEDEVGRACADDARRAASVHDDRGLFVDGDGEDTARAPVLELARDERERATETLARDDVLVGDDAAHVAPAEEVVCEPHGRVVRVCERERRGRAVRATAVIDELALYGLARACPADASAARIDRLDRP